MFNMTDEELLSHLDNFKIFNNNDVYSKLRKVSDNFPKINYDSWIKAWRKEKPRAHGMCYYAARMMNEVFPELKLVRGKVIAQDFSYLKTPKSGPIESSHWWCIDPNGNIQDPTADQFVNIILYVPAG